MIGRTPHEDELALGTAGLRSHARIAMGDIACPLYQAPQAAPVTRPGTITLILGALPSGRPAAVTATSLQWLDSLESAIQAARAAAVTGAGTGAR